VADRRRGESSGAAWKRSVSGVAACNGGPPYSDGKRCGKGFRVGDRSRAPLRDARRFPSTRWYPVPGATRTTLGFGICPSFKGHFLSRRAKPFR
jgi:hypothetical protein